MGKREKFFYSCTLSSLGACRMWKTENWRSCTLLSGNMFSFCFRISIFIFLKHDKTYLMDFKTCFRECFFRKNNPFLRKHQKDVFKFLKKLLKYEGDDCFYFQKQFLKNVMGNWFWKQKPHKWIIFPACVFNC